LKLAPQLFQTAPTCARAERCRHGVHQKLLGRDGPSSSVKRTADAVEHALSRLADERASANKAIIAAADERRRMLLSDASDDEVAEFDKKTDALRLTIDRCEVAEPRLGAEL
jgi:xanthine dehydrogenase iron-sulfur cluster and FAD-binding subunit A